MGGELTGPTIKTVTAAPPVNPDAFRWKFLETVLGNGHCRCEFLKLPASKMCVFFYLFVFCYNYPATNWWTVKLRSWYDYLNTAGLYFFSERQAGNKLKSKASKKRKKTKTWNSNYVRNLLCVSNCCLGTSFGFSDQNMCFVRWGSCSFLRKRKKKNICKDCPTPNTHNKFKMD